MICKGVTLSGKKCTRKSTGEFCFQHRTKTRHRECKPDSCVVCCESLEKQRHPLSCGHWIHQSCVVRSAKSQCPICRSHVVLSARATRQLEQIARQRNVEQLADDEQQLREAQRYMEQHISPELQTRIIEILDSLVNEHVITETMDNIQLIFDAEDMHSIVLYGMLEL